MTHLPTTTSLLLEALRDEDAQQAWEEFDRRYRPVLVAFAHRLGLAGHEALEVTQDTLATCAEELRAGRYDSERGRLRSWIFAVVRARIGKLKRSRAKRLDWRGDSALAGLPDDEELSAIWEVEWRQVLLKRAFHEVRRGARFEPSTLRAFELVTLEGRSADEAGSELGMNANAVHAAKFRVLERLRLAFADLEDRA